MKIARFPEKRSTFLSQASSQDGRKAGIY